MSEVLHFDMERHNLSSIFGDIDADDRLELKASIRESGLVDPTIWVYEDQVLDGWNRKSIVHELDAEDGTALHEQIVYRDYMGDDPIRWVMGRNMHRRHLSQTQRAAIVTDAFNWNSQGRPSDNDGDADTLTVKEAAVLAGVSERMIRRARRVLKSADSSTKDALKAGKTTIGKEHAKLERVEKHKSFARDLGKWQYRLYIKSDVAHDESLSDQHENWWADHDCKTFVEGKLIAEATSLSEQELVDLVSIVYKEFCSMCKNFNALPASEKARAKPAPKADDEPETKTVEPPKSQFDEPADDEEDEPEESGALLTDSSEEEDDDDFPPPEVRVTHADNGYLNPYNIQTYGDAVDWLGEVLDVMESNEFLNRLSDEHAEAFAGMISSVTHLQEQMSQ